MAQTRKGHGEKQTRKQAEFIANLLTESTVKGAAEKTGIGDATAYRWMKEPSFQESYREARWQSVSQAVRQSQQLSVEAMNTIRSIMNNENAPSGSRLSAARSILEFAVKTAELEDLTDRVEKLEKYAEEYQKREEKRRRQEIQSR